MAGPRPVTAPLALNPLVAKLVQDWSPVEEDMLAVIELDKLLAVERATVKRAP